MFFFRTNDAGGGERFFRTNDANFALVQGVTDAESVPTVSAIGFKTVTFASPFNFTAASLFAPFRYTGTPANGDTCRYPNVNGLVIDPDGRLHADSNDINVVVYYNNGSGETPFNLIIDDSANAIVTAVTDGESVPTVSAVSAGSASGAGATVTATASSGSAAAGAVAVGAGVTAGAIAGSGAGAGAAAASGGGSTVTTTPSSGGASGGTAANASGAGATATASSSTGAATAGASTLGAGVTVVASAPTAVAASVIDGDPVSFDRGIALCDPDAPRELVLDWMNEISADVELESVSYVVPPELSDSDHKISVTQKRSALTLDGYRHGSLYFIQATAHCSAGLPVTRQFSLRCFNS